MKAGMREELQASRKASRRTAVSLYRISLGSHAFRMEQPPIITSRSAHPSLSPRRKDQ
jgi:hypothetical protein